MGLLDRFRKKEEESKRFGDDAPLGLRLGASVSVSLIDFFSKGGKLLMEAPPEESFVVRLGHIALDATTIAWRAYLADGVANDPTAIVQVTVSSGKVEEIILFTPYDTVQPGTADEWCAWIDHDGIIGHACFNIDFEDDVTGEKELYEYDRVWSDSQAEYIRPHKFTENICFDIESSDDEMLQIENTAMLYGRELAPVEDGEEAEYEYMLISERESKTSDEIAIWAGFPVSAEVLMVI